MSKNLKKSNTRWSLVVYDVIVYIIASILLLWIYGGNGNLTNAGLGEEDVTDIGCTLDEATQQYTVTFTFQDIKNTCMVDAANFVVLSSIQG